MTHDGGGERRMPEPDQQYYDAILNRLEDRSDLLMPLSQESARRIAIIDGGEEHGWWAARVYAVDEEEGTFVVDDPSGQPGFG